MYLTYSQTLYSKNFFHVFWVIYEVGMQINSINNNHQYDNIKFERGTHKAAKTHK